LEEDLKSIKDPFERRTAILERRKQQHRDHLQDAYNKTHKVVKDAIDMREEKIKPTV